MVDRNTKQELKRIWCGWLIIGLVAITALGFIGLQAPKVYSQARVQAQVQAQRMEALAREQAQAQRMEVALAREQAQRMEALAREQEQRMEALAREQLQRMQEQRIEALAREQEQRMEALAQEAQKQNQQLMQDAVFLGLAAIVFISALMLLSKQRNKLSLTLTGQLILFIPEECVAELGALYEQLKSEQHSVWLIRAIMLWNFWGLLWALYVQINLENLRLPQNQGRKKIDD